MSAFGLQISDNLESAALAAEQAAASRAGHQQQLPRQQQQMRGSRAETTPLERYADLIAAQLQGDGGNRLRQELSGDDPSATLAQLLRRSSTLRTTVSVLNRDEGNAKLWDEVVNSSPELAPVDHASRLQESMEIAFR